MSGQRQLRLVLLGIILCLPGVFVCGYSVGRLAVLATIYRHDAPWEIVSTLMIVVLALGAVMLAAGANVVQAALRRRLPVWPTVTW